MTLLLNEEQEEILAEILCDQNAVKAIRDNLRTAPDDNLRILNPNIYWDGSPADTAHSINALISTKEEYNLNTLQAFLQPVPEVTGLSIKALKAFSELNKFVNQHVSPPTHIAAESTILTSPDKYREFDHERTGISLREIREMCSECVDTTQAITQIIAHVNIDLPDETLEYKPVNIWLAVLNTADAYRVADNGMTAMQNVMQSIHDKHSNKFLDNDLKQIFEAVMDDSNWRDVEIGISANSR